MKKNNKRKAFNRRIAILVAAVVVLIAGVYYFKNKKTDVDTKKAPHNVQMQKQVSSEDIISAEQLEKMQKGYYLNKTLGYINPIYSGYNPNEIVKGENIIKSAQSYAVPANEVAQMLAGKSTSTTKEVFLTFDDGPSPNNTPKILDILKENDVHATFFVVGTFLKSNPKLQKVVREEMMQGNAIGDHTFDHNYSELYPHNSVDVTEYLKQDTETDTLLNAILGPNFKTRIIRMPGGYMSRKYYNDPHLNELDEKLDANHITALDWDAETGDAETSGQLDVNKLLENVKKGIQGKNQVVILMHDAGEKVDTVKALPALIQYFKENGYEFKVIKNAPIDSFNNLPKTTSVMTNQA